ncbi:MULTISPECIES: hypothetical protein [Vibrio]|uniref:hypothetical protein n=1 Tax=Vibrio TaxID=662 RepID=UPI00078CA8AE|nr:MULTISPECIES: hypothetical protein [Vibrio]BAU71077.1 hypothetical protein [Vibrio sp. 04Ya108]BBM67661.1 hypothetical protein VA249_43070 [Vibrio alfacsensis]BCN27159.1 hypothetical protein VYA_43510 [Vibrio alfacsensis]
MNNSIPYQNGYLVHSINLDKTHNPYPKHIESLQWARKDWLNGWLAGEQETKQANDISHRITGLMS